MISLKKKLLMAGGGVSDPDARVVIARMSPRPSPVRQKEINKLISRLKTVGVWSRLNDLYLTAAHSRQAATLNWRRASNDIIIVGNIPFTVDRGLQSVSANDADSNYAYVAYSRAAPGDSSIGAILRIDGSSAGGGGLIGWQYASIGDAGGSTGPSFQMARSSLGGIPNSLAGELLLGEAISSNNSVLGVANSAQATGARTPIAVNYAEFYLTKGWPDGFDQARLGVTYRASWIGTAMTAGEMRQLRAEIDVCLRAIGAIA